MVADLRGMLCTGFLRNFRCVQCVVVFLGEARMVADLRGMLCTGLLRNFECA